MKIFSIISLAVILAFAAPSAFAAESVPELKSAAEAAVKIALAAPGDYEANWKASKALRSYGDEAVSQEVTGWKEIAKSIGKDGMKFGEIATKLKPEGIEGWYYYGLSVGVYSDGVSIVTAITEGLKGKTQKGFEMAYAKDKMYDKGGPILALGRFWQVLPSIAGRDTKKAQKLFEEYIALFSSDPDMGSSVWYYRGQLLKDAGKVAEAKADLQKAAGMGNKAAAKLLAGMK